METSFYLVVNATGSVKTLKSQPSLNWNEVAIKMDLKLPDELFRKPMLQAKIEVDPKQVQPVAIDAQTVNNIQEAIYKELGIDMKIEVVPTENIL